MLFDPLEEQFDLPATAIEFGDRECRRSEIVGQEDQRLVGPRILEADATQWRVEILARIETGEHDRLIADQAGRAIDRMRVATLDAEIGFAAGNEEALCQVKARQSLEVEKPPVHDVERTRLGQQLVEDVDLVQLAIADVDEARDIAAQIEQRVQLDGRLGGAKWRPRKHRQAQIDGGGIECVNCVVQFDPKGLFGIQPTGDANETLRKVGIDAPVAHGIGIGQRVAGHVRANAQMVQLGALGAQTGFDVAQALAVSQLREGHGAELLRATQTAHSGIAAITRHDARKAGPRNELHNLCEQRLAHVHSSPPENSISGRYLNWNMGELISNRHQHKSLCKPRQYSILAREFVS